MLRWSLHTEYLSGIILCERQEEVGLGRGRSQTIVQAQQSLCQHWGNTEEYMDPQSLPCGVRCHAGLWEDTDLSLK